MRTPWLLSVLLVVVLPQIAWSHPGHAVEIVPSDSAAHYLLQPAHLLEVALAAAVVVLVLLWIRSRVGRQLTLCVHRSPSGKV